MNGDPLEEYKDVSNNLRYYGSRRFALLALFTTFSGAIMTVILLGDASPLGKTILKAIGLILVIVMTIMDERSTKYWAAFCKRAEELEKILNYQQYTNRPSGKIFTTTNAVRLFYGGLFIFWLVGLVRPRWF